MNWIKRLSVLLVGLLLGSILIVAAVVLFLDEADHKRLLVWVAGQFLDSELVIDGPLELDIARDLSLASGGIRLEANDGSYRLAVGRLRTSFRLGSYMRTGTFWFNSLDLTDVNLEVTETGNEGTALEDFQLPPVVIARAHFNNFALSYREQPPGTLHRFSLEELIIEESGRGQPVSLHATGLFEGQPFVLEGTSDSIAELLEDRGPNRVQLSLRGATGQLRVEGTIADPVKGHGLDLQVQASIPQIRELIETLWDEIPVLGSLQGSLTVRGDYTAPSLEAIDLHLQREQEVDLHVTGSVADALTGTGLDLQLDGQSSNPEIISWLLFKKYDRMQAVQVSGRLQGDAARPSLHELDASAETADGLKLKFGGSAVVHPAGHRLTQADAGLAVQFSAPNLSAANLPGLEKLQVPGPASGSLALALGMDAVGIYAADIDIGSQDNNRIQLKGDIGYVLLTDKPEMSGLKLQTDIRTTELARLSEQLDYALPALGPARLRGTVISRGPELVLQGARLDIGTPGQSTLHATGMLATQLHDPARFKVAMDVDVQTTALDRLGKQLDYALPALGPARLRGKLLSRDAELLLQNARLDIGTAVQTTLRATGELATQLDEPARFRVAMDVDIRAAELARLGKQFDVTLPELGQTRITGRLDTTRSGWQFRDARLVVGAADQPVIRANGSVTTESKQGSTLDITLDAAVAELIAAYTDQSPGYLGRLQGDAVISSLDGRWSVEKFSLASTRTSLYQLNLSGRYGDLVKHDAAMIDSSLDIKRMDKLGEALDLDLAGMGSLRGEGQLSLNQGRLRYDGEASVGNTKSTTTIKGHLEDGKPVLSGSFKIPVLYLADFGIGPLVSSVPAEDDQDEPASPHVFSRKPLDIGFLNNFDLDMALSIDEVESGELAIDSVNGKLKLHNGQLRIKPLRLVFEGGNTDIDLDIRARDVPEYRLAMTADDLKLGPLMAQVQEQVPIRGYTNVHLDVQTQGRSPHEMATNLSGSASLGLENARIPKHYVELLSIDIFGWVVSKTGARQQPHMNLNCLVMTFAVEAGEVKSETFIADGPRLNLGGQIDMNLGTETLDIIVIPTQKKRFFSSISPVTVKGPMKDPKVEAVPIKTALQEIGTMALLPGVAIPARAIGKLWSLMDDDDQAGEGCANIDELREAAKREATGKKAPAQDWDSDWE